ncbi:30S ribosomal protein S8 [Candidatus Uhrbacteria bacterium CG22_combo_CG10-13_8_21_14_all_47_17]|uniref:Small ribosomal subunit protein uS8 n=1 Tax=Candidatus Uhrbacteria bacterium CG22_combo_CG10-13_8_21_14_all_47_17 TaxID=1975041 RepID=A0A2H0BRW6_9BACT|nr:MAG: 30S ribosomal protein S8 [Candidatus Uhrbacteria bacterium CG22_combo_CG10-13_8_21_14_all_47_17]
MYTDPISDFLTRIRNAQSAGHETVTLPGSRIKFAIAKVLQKEGYLSGVKETINGQKKTLEVGLKYEGKIPSIRSVKRISKPGCRVYRKSSELKRVLSGQGVAILSTSAGIMTNNEARRRKLGGEVLCEIY